MVNKHVLVIGDTILDETVYSNLIGVSLETPTLKAQYEKTELEFGGASNVVKNILALGARVTYATIGGNDNYNENYKNWNSDKLRLFFIEEDRQNIVKARYWIKHGDSLYKQLQINSGEKRASSDKAFDELLRICDNQDNVDCILLVDYSINIFSSIERSQKLLKALRKYNKPIIVSSQLSSNKNKYPWFLGADYMCMNKAEASANVDNFDASADSMQALSKTLGANVCVTLGEKGAVFTYGNKTQHYLPHKVNCVDSCGAGDAFLAAFSIFCESGDIELCNKWAALSTTKLGTQCPSKEKFYAY